MFLLLNACNYQNEQIKVKPVETQKTSPTSAMNSSTMQSWERNTLFPTATYSKPYTLQTRVHVATPTMSPTLTHNQLDTLATFIESNDGCKLPCILGFLPGHTSVDQARERISEKWPGAAQYDPTYKKLDANIWYQRDGHDISNFFIATEKKDILTSIEIWLDARKNGYYQSVDAVLPFYSLESIFSQLGSPDYIYIYPPGSGDVPEAYSLEIYYLEKRIYIGIGGDSEFMDEKTYKMCPDRGGNNYVTLQMFVHSDDASINEQIENSKGDERQKLLEEATGVSVSSFVNSIILQDNYCLTYKPNY